MLARVLILTFVFGSVVSQGKHWGGCPNVNVQQRFNLNRYMGTWFEFERYNVFFERGVKCGRADYAVTSPTTVSVTNSGTKLSDGTRNEAIGVATIPDPNQPAKLKVKFGASPIAGNYWVLSTDYTSYAIVYSCTNLYVAHFDVIWILSRNRAGLTDGVRHELHQKITSAGLDITLLKRQSQHQCVN